MILDVYYNYDYKYRNHDRMNNIIMPHIIGTSFLQCLALKVSIGVDYTGDALQPSNYRPGSSLRLTCRVEGNTGYLRYRWTTTCTSSRCFVRNWYTGSSVSDNILSYVDAGNHTCTVTDGEGNTGTSTATVNIEGIYVYMYIHKLF